MPVHSRFLRYFLAVSRHGSIRRAAEELRIAASAIDRQIVLAEESLGAPLFERLPGGLRLTAAGEMLLHRARGWTKEFAILRSELDELRGLRRGTVSLAVIEALGRGVLPALLGRFKAGHPMIDLQVSVRNVAQIVGAVASQDADLGLALDPEPARGVSIRPLATVPLGFVLPPGHPLAGQRGLRPGAVADDPVVLPAEPLALARHVARIEGAGPGFRRAAASDNIQMIKSLVRAGAGISVLSAVDVHEEVEAGELHFVPVEGTVAPPLVLALCIAPNRRLSQAANALIRHVEESMTAAFGQGRRDCRGSC